MITRIVRGRECAFALRCRQTSESDTLASFSHRVIALWRQINLPGVRIDVQMFNRVLAFRCVNVCQAIDGRRVGDNDDNPQ